MQRYWSIRIFYYMWTEDSTWENNCYHSTILWWNKYISCSYLSLFSPWSVAYEAWIYMEKLNTCYSFDFSNSVYQGGNDGELYCGILWSINIWLKFCYIFLEQQELCSAGHSSRQRTLEDLFRPPIDLLHRGSFHSVSWYLKLCSLCTLNVSYTFY